MAIKKTECCFCEGKPDGTMFRMGNRMAHATCVIRSLNELLDSDFDRVGDPQKVVGCLTGYVKLADDQSLPDGIYTYTCQGDAFDQLFQAMTEVKNGKTWRKVEIQK